MSIAPETAHESLALLESMLLIRGYEERLSSLFAAGQAPGTCTSVGQEASAVGVVRALGPEDRILTNHRSAGHLLARGADPARLFAEVLGKATGYCKGKSGSLHISAKELGVVLTSTIVGGELALAPGVALAKQQLGEPGIVCVFFGDGAACEGRFHESLNLAATWRLPVLYVCENNQWQAFVSRSVTMPGETIAAWAASHQVETLTVDGNDIVSVRHAAERAVARIRETGRPYFLEVSTYRLRGHYGPDDQHYVDAAELAHWKARDPIERLRSQLMAQRVLGEGEFASLKRRVADVLEAALAEAQAAPPADLAELTTDVYA